ncbi:MAG: tetratricopeptide repeat protein [Chitinophagaceae bacterium]|nr:tetratricopeptide repeat protein [Chitinophagaceae bacterium]
MKRKKIIILIAAITVNSFFAKAQVIDEARYLIDNEKYQSAESLLEKFAGAISDEPEASNLLIKTYFEQDKKEEAKQFIKTRLLPAISNTSNPLEKVAYARYLLGTGNKPAADDIFTSLLNDKKNQKNASLLMAMAEVYIDEEAGDPKMAIEWLNMAEKRDKNNPQADILKGLAYRRIPDATNAFLAYTAALKKDPGNVRAHYLIGKIFTAQKNPDVYMEHFQKAYQTDSSYAPVLEELYNHYYYRDVRLAKKYLEEFIVHADYSLRHEYYLTDILYLNGEYANAIRAAKGIIAKIGDESQPRLYKLIAYSYAKSGDSAQALPAIKQYFEKEEPAKTIAADFELRARLTERISGTEDAVISYYTIAFEMDTLAQNKARYAAKIAALYKQADNQSQLAIWLGKLYQWKAKPTNVDLFNWGLAHYTARDYKATDSVFGLYVSRYPNDIYGYYWRAQANAAIDTSMNEALAVPYYIKVVEIGEENINANTKMLLKAYGYLGGYEANITKDYTKSLMWFEKYLSLDAGNEDIAGYVETLKKWIENKK